MLSIAAAVIALSVAQPSSGQPESDPAAESKFLSDARQLTFAVDWAKAGESYFSPDGKLVVFQAVPRPDEDVEPDPNYGMYVTLLESLNQRGNDIEAGDDIPFWGYTTKVSPDGSANTCGWFHPHSEYLLFGSTLVSPSADNQPGYQRGTGRYRWSFPHEMNVVISRCAVGEISDWPASAGESKLDQGRVWQSLHVMTKTPTPVFERPGYTAECSYSPDARHILYAQVDEEKSNEQGKPDADLWVYDTESEEHTILVEAEGYDGGPFFSPDGKWICYRSDRKGNNLLQLFVSELAYDESGKITGISREIQLTDNRHVNWAPFWHPSGEYMLYASSEVSHGNYEVFAIRFDADNPEKKQTPIRITHAAGFDGLPVFSADGEYMMWTAQRGDDRSPDGKASSQLWIAKWNGLGDE